MRLLFCILFMMALTPALADAQPIPPRKTEALSELQDKLETEQKTQKALEQKAAKIKEDLEHTQSNLVRIGQKIRSHEEKLRDLEEQIAEMEGQKKRLHEALSEDRQAIAHLIMALQRLRRVPPEALIAKPGAPLQAAQSALLMRDILPALKTKSAALRAQLEKLQILSDKLLVKKELALDASKNLQGDHQQLIALLSERKRLYRGTQSSIKEQSRRIEKIATQARNLQELIHRLDEDERRSRTRNSTKKAVLSTPRLQRFIPKALKGDAQLPISGIIRIGYNQPDELGAPSKGLHIQGRASALVTAPMPGRVRFAGPFRNYGRLIILEHADGYHSLIAGFEKIDTVVGRYVAAGEPLGLLGYGNAKAPATLYYELRFKGHPVNPKKKFSNLGS